MAGLLCQFDQNTCYRTVSGVSKFSGYTFFCYCVIFFAVKKEDLTAKNAKDEQGTQRKKRLFSIRFQYIKFLVMFIGHRPYRHSRVGRNDEVMQQG